MRSKAYALRDSIEANPIIQVIKMKKKKKSFSLSMYCIRQSVYTVTQVSEMRKTTYVTHRAATTAAYRTQERVEISEKIKVKPRASIK